ncbi:MAG: efflux RND transporter periplasmic adaptor subunit [Spirochaetota bacterium]
MTASIKTNKLIALLAALPVFLSFGCRGRTEEAVAPIQHRVTAVAAEEKDMAAEIESFGSISFLKKADVSSAVEGIIKSMDGREGDPVRKGQNLTIIENIQLDIRKKQAESSVKRAETALELARTKYHEGKLQVDARLISIEKLAMELDQKKRELAELSKAIEKKEELFKVDGISEEALNSLRLSYLASETNYKTMLKDMEIRKIGLRDEDIIARGLKLPSSGEEKRNLFIQINTATLAAEVDAAQANLVSAWNELESADQLLNELTLSSPMAGIIGAKYKEEGERVSQGDKVYTIFDTSKVLAVFTVQENQALLISEGMEVQVKIDALGEKTLPAKVHLVSPVIDPQSGNMIVKAMLKNLDDTLRPGMFLRARVIYGTPKKTIVLPVSCLAEKKGSKAKIFKIINGRAFQKEIRLGTENEGKVEAVSGVSKGDIIIDAPSPVLREGEEVIYEKGQV